MTTQQRRPWIIASVLGLLASCAAPPGERGSLSDLYRLREARTRRVSSADPNWQDGNNDRRPIDPGGTLTVADLDGPGVIRHIWFTISAEDPKYGRSLVLRMYWDDSDDPAVESPIGDFFAVGHGARRYVDSLPVAVSSEGRACNCYWPMPFKKRARITLTNDSNQYKVRSVYFYVDYDDVPDLPADTAYFHAQYRQEYPAGKGDYLLCDTVGRGHYVGTVLSARFRTKSWFGEGDDRFYIDGETEPSLRGTGTEDYFCDAWGFREFMRPYYGVVTFDGFGVGDRVTVYRWHIADPVHFSKSLKVTIEHKGVMFNEAGKRVSSHYERPDLFSSVAFWYQTGKAKRFATLPPAQERVVQSTTIEMESFLAGAKATPATVELTTQDGRWSGGKQLFAPFKAPDGKLTLPFKVEKDTSGLAQLKLTRSWDYGIWKVSLDGKVLKGLAKSDLYNPSVKPTDSKVGYIELTAGQHELTFECLGKNPDSKGYCLGVDAIEVEHLTPYADTAQAKK